MKSKLQLSFLACICSLTAAAQVNNTFNSGSGNAAAGINYPSGLAIPGPVNAQPQLNIYAFNSSQGVGGESFIECRQAQPVSGNGDFFDVSNASGSSAMFVPKLTGSVFNHSRSALVLAANIISKYDSSNSNALMTFLTSANAFRLSGLGNAVVNRPLFSWNNWTNTLMMMDSRGNLGIGTGTGPIEARLHTVGRVRHEALPSGENSLLVIDGNGDVYRSNINSSSINSLNNSCSTLNFIPKVRDASGNLQCSQIFDDGVSVGINTTGSFAFTAGTGVFTAGLPASQTVRLQVNGLTRSTSYVATSDAKFKKNVTTLTDALNKVMKLRGVEYDWKVAEYPDKSFDNLKHSGFIAQELMQVLPNTVIKDANNEYAVDYNAVIPVLTAAIQEQQAQIEELKKALAANRSNTAVNETADGADKFAGAALSQNVPNPFTQTTTISYQLPTDVKTAAIGVYDLNGKELKLFDLGDQTNGSVTIDGGTMQPGMYVYTLLLNGTPYQTKKMVLTSH